MRMTNSGIRTEETRRSRLSRREALRRGLAVGAALTVGCATGGRLRAQEETAALPPEAQARVDEFRREFSVPGLQLTFLRGARVLYRGCFGEARREPRQPVRPDSLFRIASGSKPFTAAAILLLVEDGRLSLDDRIFAPGGVLSQAAQLGPQREWLDAITVQDLLTHTGGGWGNRRRDPMFQRPELNQDQLIAWTLRTHPLQHPPGEHYAYSNFGYCVLGRLIERISGQPYAEFVRQRILDPAGLDDMRMGDEQPATNEVQYYGQAGEDPYGISIARLDAHGGWIGTATDLARFLACLFSPADKEGAPALLRPESLRVMTTGSQANPDYACGLAVNHAGNAWHAGSLPGTMSIMVHTRSGLSWAAVLNTRSQRDDAARRLDDLLWEVARQMPAWRA